MVSFFYRPKNSLETEYIFFPENSINEMVAIELGNGMTSYGTKDGTLKIIGGNYFKLTPDLLGGKVDCVWDRGSLVAIDMEDRIKSGFS